MSVTDFTNKLFISVYISRSNWIGTLFLVTFISNELMVPNIFVIQSHSDATMCHFTTVKYTRAIRIKIF